MPSKTIDTEIEKDILKVVKEINLENAEHCAPVFSLEEILGFKKVTMLRELGKSYHVKYYSRLSKPELLSNLVVNMQKSELIRELFYTLEDVEWGFFVQAVSTDVFQSDRVIIDNYEILQIMGIMQSFYFNGKLWFVVPNEVKKIYNELIKTDFLVNRKFYSLINNYAIACVSLYGFISIDDFVELFNSQNSKKTTINDIFRILLKFIYTDAEYCFWDEYIVDDSFEENDFKDVNYFVNTVKGKPRYLPTKNEVLKYADWNYYEITPQIVALTNYLIKKFSLDDDEAEDIADEIHELCVAQAKTQEIFDLLEKNSIHFESMEQAQELLNLIMEVHNNTRLWANNGHTPNELFKLEQPFLKSFSSNAPPKAEKVGRNDPCPCGSGLKYKKCCGSN